MKLMEEILSEKNLKMAIKKVKQNKGAPGVDKMTVQEVERWFEQYREELISKMMNKQYRPMPVKRVYIPKPNGKQRPLGIPTVVDRVIQQAVAQVLNTIYEPIFSEHSYGFRPRRSAHMAMEEVKNNLSEGYEWMIDLDIEKFFDNVNQEKLMMLINQRISDRRILKLIRQWLKAGVLYGNILEISELGTSQGSLCGAPHNDPYADTFIMLGQSA